MSQTNQTEDIYRVARDLLPEMEPEMRKSIEALLQQVEKGRKTDNLIVDIITENDVLRHKLREMLGNDDNERSLGGYLPLGGDPEPPSAQKFVCPMAGHDFSKRISKAGEDPGNCPVHNLPLILASPKKRGE